MIERVIYTPEADNERAAIRLQTGDASLSLSMTAAKTMVNHQTRNGIK